MFMRNGNLLFLQKRPNESEPAPSVPREDEEFVHNGRAFVLNKKLQKQINKITDQDAATPYDISKFDLDETTFSAARLLCTLQEQLRNA